MKLQYRKSVNTRKYRTIKVWLKKTLFIILLLTATYTAGLIDLHNIIIMQYQSIEAYGQQYDKQCIDSICSQIIETKKEVK